MSNCSIGKEAGTRRLAALLILLGMAAAMFMGIYFGMFYMAVKVGLRLG